MKCAITELKVERDIVKGPQPSAGRNIDCDLHGFAGLTQLQALRAWPCRCRLLKDDGDRKIKLFHQTFSIDSLQQHDRTRSSLGRVSEHRSRRSDGSEREARQTDDGIARQSCQGAHIPIVWQLP